MPIDGQRCSQCHHWAKLVSGPKSYGECMFTLDMAGISDPMRFQLRGFEHSSFGATHPDAGKQCAAFVQRITLATK